MASFCDSELIAIGATISSRFPQGKLYCDSPYGHLRQLVRRNEKGKVKLIVLTDFSKAFDTVHNKNFLAKLVPMLAHKLLKPNRQSTSIGTSD